MVVGRALDGMLRDADPYTELLTAGEWERVAARMGVDRVMLVDEAGRVYITPAMRERVRFEAEDPELIISTP